MYGIDETTRQPKNLVLGAGTDRLLVDAAGVTLEAGDISLDLTATNALLTDIKALLTTIAANTAP